MPTRVYNLNSGGRLYVAPMIDESGSTLQFAFSSSRLEGRSKRQPDGSFADDDSCQTRFVFTDETVSIQTCKTKSVGVRELAVVRRPLRLKLAMGPGGAANSSLVTGVYADGFPEFMFDWIENNLKTTPHK